MKKNRRPPFFAAVLPVSKHITIGTTFLLSLLVFLHSVEGFDGGSYSDNHTVAIVLGQK
jgi:hypothetical protein